MSLWQLLVFFSSCRKIGTWSFIMKVSLVKMTWNRSDYRALSLCMGRRFR